MSLEEGTINWIENNLTENQDFMIPSGQSNLLDETVTNSLGTLATLKLKRTELLKKLNPKTPDVRVLDQQMAYVEKDLMQSLHNAKEVLKVKRETLENAYTNSCSYGTPLPTA